MIITSCKVFFLFTFLTLSLVSARPVMYLSFDKGIDSDAGDQLSLSNGVMLDSGFLALQGQLNPLSGTTDSAALRPQGISGQGLLIGRSADDKNHYSVKYYPEGGLSSLRGSFSFWLKPLSWKGSDDNAAMFLSAEAPNQQLFIYKYWKRQELYFYYAVDKEISLVVAPISDWKENEWHHIACTWNEAEMKLYLDGQLQKTAQIKKIGTSNFDSLNVGTCGWPNKTGQSLIDEVFYYQTVVKPEAVLLEYQRLNNQLTRSKAPVAINVGRATPGLDGEIKPFEYAFAATGFFDVRSQSLASSQSRYFLAYNEEALFIGVSTPAGDNLITEKQHHDENLWEDDSIELHFLTGESNERKFQFIINADAVVFDARNNQPKWNAPGIECASEIKAGDWIIEVRIPWKDFELQGVPDNLLMNLCRTFQKTALFTAISPSMRSYADKPNLTELIFRPDVPRLDLSSIGNLNKRELDFRLSALASQDESLLVELSTDNAVLPFQWEKQLQLAANTPAKINCEEANLPANTRLSLSIRQGNLSLYENTIPYCDITPVTVDYLYTNSETGNMHLVCTVHQTDLQASMRLQLLDRDGKLAYQQEKELDCSTVSTEAIFNLSNVKPGDYKIQINAFDADKNEIFANYEDLRIPEANPAWANCQAGISDMVPPPWTPLTCREDSVDILGRTYRYGGRGLLSSIHSRGCELLASDVILKVNQQAVSFTVRKKRVRETGYDAEYVLTGTTADMKITVDILVEFDGCQWFTLAYEPLGKEVAIHSMTLEIPLNRQYMTMFDDNRGIMTKVDLKKESRSEIANDLSTMPCFWIGCEEVGLMGGMANLRGWYVQQKKNSMELKLSDKVVTSVWNLIDTPLQLEKPRNLEFYLQATPVKDKNRNTRSFREGRNVLVWTTFGKKYFEYHIEPETMDLERLAGIKREREARHWRNFYYMAPHGVSPYSPDWNYFGWLWHSSPPNLGNYCVDGAIPTRERRNKVAFTYACFDCPSFFDYKLYGLNKLIENPDFGIENMYYDLTWPKTCNNTAHGCGWTDEFGVRMSSFDIKGTREFNKRTYQLLKKKNPDAMFVYHLISTRTPSDSFADLLVQGESYDRAVAEKESYYDVFTPDMMRIAYNARSNEQEIWLIPQFLRAMQLFNPKRAAEWHSPQPTLDYACKHFLGYLMVHDLGFLYGWSTREPGTQLQKIQDQLGWDEHVVFHPYWKPSPVSKVSPDNDRVLVSAYTRGKQALLAVLNDTDQEKEVNISVDSKTLFGEKGAYTGTDGFAEAGTNADFQILDDRLELTVPPRGFRCIVFSGKKNP
ncbi:MAG: DUF6067 family protein [Lentisphaeria bacterium]|nr:DUF6067 family protein [Lentisphaeria bacterium]